MCSESSLTIEGNLNTSVKQTVCSSDNGARTRSQPHPVNTECRYLIDPVLSYIHYSLQSGTQEKIKMAVLSHFSSAQIAESKDALWKHCGSSLLGEKSKRRNTPNRSESEANVLDILQGFAVLDRMEQVPLILLDSLSLGLIPRSHPEELCDISICDRLSRVEKKMLDMQEALDSCVAGNLELKDNLIILQDIHHSLSQTYS